MAYNAESYARLTHLKALGAKQKAITDAQATRIEALENVGAQANILEGIKVNDALLNLVDKIANILIAEGTANGTIAANGVNIAVHGLAALAYKAEVSETELATALKEKINNSATTLTTLTGSGEGSIEKQIDAAFDDFATKVTDDNVVNSYKELIDWAAEHGSEAAEMAGNIGANKTAIDDLKNLVGTLPEDATATTVVGYIAEAVAALSIGNYVTTEALNTELAKKVDKVTGKSLVDDTEITKLAGVSTGANKVEKSDTNGNVKIDGVETVVYKEPSDVLHGTTATDAEVEEMLAEIYGSDAD
jgi:hypothetical protein